VNANRPTGFAFSLTTSVIMGSLALSVVIGCVVLALLAPCKRLGPAHLAKGKSLAVLNGNSVVVMAGSDGAKAHLAAAEQQLRRPTGADRSSPSSQSMGSSAAKRSINSSEASTVAPRHDEPDEALTLSSLANANVAAVHRRQQQSQQQQRHHAIMMDNSGALGARSPLSRPESALGTSSTFAPPSGDFSATGGSLRAASRASFMRASLRSENHYQAPSAKLHPHDPMNMHDQQQAAPFGPSRFAAIHETLEHKLQFGGNNTSLMRPNGEQQHALAANEQQTGSSATLSDSSNQQLDNSNGSLASAPKQATRASLIDKIRNRFRSAGGAGQQAGADVSAASKRASLGSSTKGGRPTISMPIGGMVSGSVGASRLRRSSLSSSLVTVGGGAGDQQQLTGQPQLQPAGSMHANSMKHSMMMHLNQISGNAESNLVSSSANLIQDSGTASDGTTNSGRSSRTSSQQPNGHRHHHQLQQQHAFVAPINLAYQPQEHYNQPVQVISNNCDNNIVYANSVDLYELANEQNAYQQQQQQLYANGYQQAVDPSGSLAYQGQYSHQQQQVIYTTGHAGDQYQNGSLQATNEHYQMPMLMSEPYLAAAVAAAAAAANQHQADERPCYATMCNGTINKSPVHQHQQQIIQNGNSLNGAYGTLPLQRNHFEHLNDPMTALVGSPNSFQASAQQATIKTSDGGDAYFESNYGTLLSRSSAYKALGYSQQPANNSLCADSSAGSSPSSLTTHANTTPTASGQQQHLPNISNLSTNHQQHLQQRQQQQQTFSQLQQRAKQHLDQNRVESSVTRPADGQDQVDAKDESKSENPTDMNNDPSPRESPPPTSHIVNGLKPATLTAFDKQHQAQAKANAVVVVQSNGSTTTKTAAATTNTANGHADGIGSEDSLKDSLATHV
jgi:hypothetical protein